MAARDRARVVTIGSLFSGILGLDLGLEMCGLGPLVWCAEKDHYARGVIAHHRPEARLYSDVRLIDESTPRVDVICGGFPCQDISVAGKGAGLAGKRSGLWREFARVIRLLRPSLVFVENVAVLRRRGLDVVLGDLAALGFDADWTTVRASDVGAPHIRERIFLLAHFDRGELRQLAERIEQRPAERGESEPREHGAIVVADADGLLRDGREREPRGREGGRTSARGDGEECHVADADSGRRLGLGLAESRRLESARRSEPDGRSNGGGARSRLPAGAVSHRRMAWSSTRDSSKPCKAFRTGGPTPLFGKCRCSPASRARLPDPDRSGARWPRSGGRVKLRELQAELLRLFPGPKGSKRRGKFLHTVEGQVALGRGAGLALAAGLFDLIGPPITEPQLRALLDGLTRDLAGPGKAA